jgi:dynactin complex subunit
MDFMRGEIMEYEQKLREKLLQYTDELVNLRPYKYKVRGNYEDKIKQYEVAIKALQDELKRLENKNNPGGKDGKYTFK